jgi:mRNA interferase MazF
MVKSEHNQGMESFQAPSDLEISTAYTQGEKAVLALFHRSLDLLAARLQALEDQLDPNQRANSPYQDVKTAGQMGGRPTLINQGDIYWVPVEAPGGLEPGVIHPHVVIQDNVINHSRIQSVVVCALTSNRSRVNIPGNVFLEAGEANLPKQSVVEVSKVSTVDKLQLGEYIGSLTEQRVKQILTGMQFLQFFTDPGEIDEKK